MENNKEYLTFCVQLMGFWHEMLGPTSELVLYDAETLKVHHVVNPFDDEMVPGSEMRSLEKQFLETRLYEQEDYVVNYRALSRQKYKLKSGTYFVKDPGGRLVAMLTVNENVERLLEMREIINTMVSGSQPHEESRSPAFYDSFDVSVEGMVSLAIQKELDSYDVAPVRLSAKEKMRIVKTLDEKGIFLVKGAIAELARAMATTETTIYRYLNRVAGD